MARAAKAAGKEPKDYVARNSLKDGELKCPARIPTIRTTGRATCSSGAPTCSARLGKGHEYFLKHLLGTTHGVQGKDLGETGHRSRRR
jgi:nitrate reductase alpha subunit